VCIIYFDWSSGSLWASFWLIDYINKCLLYEFKIPQIVKIKIQLSLLLSSNYLSVNVGLYTLWIYYHTLAFVRYRALFVSECYCDAEAALIFARWRFFIIVKLLLLLCKSHSKIFFFDCSCWVAWYRLRACFGHIHRHREWDIGLQSQTIVDHYHRSVTHDVTSTVSKIQRWVTV